MNGAPKGAVVNTAANYRPAIIVSGFDKVELVTTLRSVLRFPQISRNGMYSQTLRAPMAIGPDLGQDTVHADKRVVIRYSSVIIQSHNNPLMIAPILS